MENQRTRKPFSKEDNDTLINLMKKYINDPCRYKKISQEMGNKFTSKQIRQRWLNHCQDRLNKGTLEDNEKSFIIDWVEKYRSQNPFTATISWKKLIPEMENSFGKLFSESQLKNYWHSRGRQKRKKINPLEIYDLIKR
ncbi:hypothetical protein GLOIN_2v1482553 [Rhizophagus clarus]|uniref:HTH myb-type domain-containing protein n=1 Tax=Rhizophagus clarus TaxID=94130 RepID=A0A8H3QAP6_9GLOM|nr:hypothetical protein GLOIN_2v1482553 [Rhizophagus clarus]